MPLKATIITDPVIRVKTDTLYRDKWVDKFQTNVKIRKDFPTNTLWVLVQTPPYGGFPKRHNQRLCVPRKIFRILNLLGIRHDRAKHDCAKNFLFFTALRLIRQIAGAIGITYVIENEGERGRPLTNVSYTSENPQVNKLLVCFPHSWSPRLPRQIINLFTRTPKTGG